MVDDRPNAKGHGFDLDTKLNSLVSVLKFLNKTLTLEAEKIEVKDTKGVFQFYIFRSFVCALNVTKCQKCVQLCCILIL